MTTHIRRFRNCAALIAGTALVLGLSACNRPAEPASASAPIDATAPIAKPELGTFGLDTAGMNRSVLPGDNFFEYTNGIWVKNTEIPPDRSSYSQFSRLAELAQSRERAIIEEAAADQSASAEVRKIGDFYTAFMDEAGIEAKGLAPIQPELDDIAAITDKKALAEAIGKTLRADLDLLNNTNYYTPNLFGLWVSQNIDKPAEIAPYLAQGGLSLPDRDFYLEGGRYLELRNQYQAHVAKVLDMAGIAESEAKARRIVALETAIARVHATQVETNDVQSGANYWSRADFSSKAPGLDWDTFFAAADLSEQAQFIVWQPKAIAGISGIVASGPLQDWKDYLAFHALDQASNLLPKAFADENFAFYGTTLSGIPEQRDRWKRGVNAVDGALGEAVGKIYVQRHFSAQTKARADELVANVLAAFDKRIDRVEWMNPQTKVRAKAKLAALKVDMGYPETWRDYSTLEIRPDDALGNAHRASLFEYQRNLAKLGQPAGRAEWYMLPQQVNAMNVPLESRLIFPAAILDAPFFDGAADDAINYGAIGAVIGHEISHSFDSSGALFDENGRLDNWWTPEDLKNFNAAGDALVAQYDAYHLFPDAAVNGRLTLGENIADVAGLATAYDAYTLSQQGKPAQTLEGFTPDQRFFLGFAQNYRGKTREASARNRLLTDVHSPGPFRSETARNLDAWYPAFDVQPGQQRYLAPEQRVKVW